MVDASLNSDGTLLLSGRGPSVVIFIVVVVVVLGEGALVVFVEVRVVVVLAVGVGIRVVLMMAMVVVGGLLVVAGGVGHGLQSVGLHSVWQLSP